MADRSVSLGENTRIAERLPPDYGSVCWNEREGNRGRRTNIRNPLETEGDRSRQDGIMRTRMIPLH